MVRNRRIYEMLTQSIESIKEKYMWEPFDIITTDKMENDIKNVVVELIPDFYSHVNIAEGEIYIDNIFFKQYFGVLQLLPCVFDVREAYRYELFVGRERVGDIYFEKNIDPCEYGYIVTFEPFEPIKRFEYVIDATNAVLKTRNAIDNKEGDAHDEQKQD